MDKFLEAHNLLRMIQGEIDSLMRSIMTKKVESVIKNLQHQNLPGPKKHKFYQIFKEINVHPSQTLLNFKEEVTLLNSFYETRITLMPKTGKNTSRKV